MLERAVRLQSESEAEIKGLNEEARKRMGELLESRQEAESLRNRVDVLDKITHVTTISVYFNVC